jgi:hypothetical protein
MMGTSVGWMMIGDTIMARTTVDRTDEFVARLVGILNANYDESLRTIAWEHGLTWYQDAHDYAVMLTEQFNLTLAQACGIMAATSIRTRWTANLRDAVLASGGLLNTGLKIRYQKCNEIRGMAEPTRDDVQAVLRILKGPKISAFALNILDPNGRVATIDVWMCRAFDVPHSAAKGKTYDQMQAAVQIVADMLDLPVPTVQAIVWVLVRGSAD